MENSWNQTKHQNSIVPWYGFHHVPLALKHPHFLQHVHALLICRPVLASTSCRVLVMARLSISCSFQQFVEKNGSVRLCRPKSLGTSFCKGCNGTTSKPRLRGFGGVWLKIGVPIDAEIVSCFLWNMLLWKSKYVFLLWMSLNHLLSWGLFQSYFESTGGYGNPSNSMTFSGEAIFIVNLVP